MIRTTILFLLLMVSFSVLAQNDLHFCLGEDRLKNSWFPVIYSDQLEIVNQNSQKTIKRSRFFERDISRLRCAEFGVGKNFYNNLTDEHFYISIDCEKLEREFLNNPQRPIQLILSADSPRGIAKYKGSVVGYNVIEEGNCK